MERSGAQAGRLAEDPAAFLTAAIQAYVAASVNNRLPGFPGEVIWDAPLVGFADGDDPLFHDYKRIIGDFHVTPREALEMRIRASECGPPRPAAVSVISFVLPSTPATRQSQRPETAVCSLRWNYARWYGQECIFRLSRHLVALLEDQGYHAVAPELAPWFEVKGDVPNGPASRWSQRHIAYAAGLGTFSLNDGFITPKGLAVRLGSVVCDLPIPVSPRVAPHYMANCLFSRDGACGKCIDRCPVGAITDRGHDKGKCAAYLRQGMPLILQADGRVGYVGPYPGCGLCQTGVPCESRIPIGEAGARRPLDSLSQGEYPGVAV
jgi:epoxyqueuosine reductase